MSLRKLVAVSLLSGATVLTGAMLTMPNASSSVDSKSTTASVTVLSACSLSNLGGGSEYYLTVDPGLVAEVTGSTLKAICNDSNGLSVYAVGFGNNTVGETRLVGARDGHFINTGLATSGNISSWAMKLTSGTGSPVVQSGYGDYSVIPDEQTKVLSYGSSTDSVSGVQATASYRVYAAPTQALGTYAGAVKYTLVHPSSAPVPTACGSLPTMQNIANLKSTLFATEEQQVQLCDERDGKEYWVAKLKDGNIWMTQNLDLELSPTKTLTPNDTDISTNYTPAVGTTENIFNSGDYLGENSYDGGDYYWKGGWNSSSQSSDVGYAYFDDYFSADISDAGTAAEHYHVGNIYQWSAATAKTGNNLGDFVEATSSICPKGWRLPDGNNPGYGFNELTTAYGIGDDAAGASVIIGSPLFFVPAGELVSGQLGDAGHVGFYWSPRGRSTVFAYRFRINQSRVSWGDYNRRYFGHTIRCVAR